MKNNTHIANILSKSAKFNMNTKYFIPYDLGVSFGSVYDGFRKWVKRDLKNAVVFNSEYVKTRFNGNKEFSWNKGVLGQARKPCLSIQCFVDHENDSEAFSHPSVKNWDSVHFLEPDEFTSTIINIEDNLDMKNNVKVSFAMKSVKFEFNAGIVTGSRNQADNIANYWTTRRSTNYYYPFDIFIDFKIPDEIIDGIKERFNKKDLSENQFLKWLNRNSKSHVYYAMDGYNGKKYFFFRYIANPLIKVMNITNPQEFELRGMLHGESYAFSRSFELEVMIPSIIAITAYGDRLILDKDGDVRKEKLSDKDNRAEINLSERFIEIERVFEDKHAIAEIHFKWSEDDLMTHADGSITSKKMKILDFLPDNHIDKRYILELIAWSKTKGYRLLDLFNFQLYKVDKNNPFTDPLVTSIDGINIPDDKFEKKYYIKNMKDLTIVDLKPDVTEPLIGIIYLDQLVKNQYEYEVGRMKESAIAHDDLGAISPYGPQKSSYDTNYK